MVKNNIETLLIELLEIESQLDNLSRKHSALYKAFDGTDFPEQKKLACDKMDNLVLAATHEMASQIGFYRVELKNLDKYISFRRKYKAFSDHELSDIIDNNLTPKAKIELQNKLMYGANLLDLKQEWNSLFENASYVKIKKGLRLL